VYCSGAHAPGDWKEPYRKLELGNVLLFYMPGRSSSKSNIRSGLNLMHEHLAAH
jgi:hypothetical protein